MGCRVQGAGDGAEQGARCRVQSKRLAGQVPGDTQQHMRTVQVPWLEPVAQAPAVLGNRVPMVWGSDTALLPWGWVRACRLGQLTQSGVRVGTHHCALGPWCPHESQLGLALGVAQLLPIAPPRLSSGLAPAAPCSLIAAAQPADLALNPFACNRLCSPEPGQAVRGPVPAVAPCLCCTEPVLPFCATLCVPWCAVPRSAYHALP